jgi:hypothetical protein
MLRGAFLIVDGKIYKIIDYREPKNKEMFINCDGLVIEECWYRRMYNTWIVELVTD